MHAFFPNKNFKSAGILHLGNVIFSEASSNSEEAKVHIEESKIDHQNFQVNACIFSLKDFFCRIVLSQLFIRDRWRSARRKTYYSNDFGKKSV